MKRPIFNPPTAPTTRANVASGPVGHYDIFNDFIDAGWFRRLKPTQSAVFLSLLRHRNNKTGLSRPSVNLLTKEATSGRRQTQRALRDLEEKWGLLVVVRHGGGNRATEYILNVPRGAVASTAAVVSTTGGNSKPIGAVISRPDRRQNRAERGGRNCRPNSHKQNLNSQPTAFDGVGGFDNGDGKEMQELNEAVTYLTDPEWPNVNRDTVVAAQKKFGPAHILAVAALAGARHGDESLHSPGGHFGNLLRSGPDALPKSHNGHGKKFLNRNRCGEYDPERPEQFRRKN